MTKPKPKRQKVLDEVEERAKRRQAPGKSIKSRENQLISLAVDLASRQLKEGSASAQVITHFLKLGSTNAELERSKLENENKLLEAKAENLKSVKKMEDLYIKALTAVRSYKGEEDNSDED